jgi:hypothetical protein
MWEECCFCAEVFLWSIKTRGMPNMVAFMVGEFFNFPMMGKALTHHWYIIKIFDGHDWRIGTFCTKHNVYLCLFINVPPYTLNNLFFAKIFMTKCPAYVYLDYNYSQEKWYEICANKYTYAQHTYLWDFPFYQRKKNA